LICVNCTSKIISVS